jgi:hypothetical protein
VTDAAAEPILFVTMCSSPRQHLAGYAAIEPLGSFVAAAGPSSHRSYFAFKLGEPRGPIGPLPVCS